jgi:hypothetical protein
MSRLKIRCEFYTIQVQGMQKISPLENLATLSQSRKGKNERRFKIIFISIAVYNNLQEIPSYPKLLRALHLCESKSFSSISRRVL